MAERPVDNIAKMAPEAVRLRMALRRYVARKVPAGDVDDLLQDVFLNLAKSQPQTSIENITAYVFRIAANLVLARGRRPQWRYVPEDVLTDMPDGGAFRPDRILESQEELRAVMQDIMALPERTRDVFLLHRFEEMTYSDISQHFGISLSAVEKHMIKALRLLSRAATDR